MSSFRLNEEELTSHVASVSVVRGSFDGASILIFFPGGMVFYPRISHHPHPTVC